LHVFVNRKKGDCAQHLAIGKNIVELGPCVCVGRLFIYNVLFTLFFLHRENGDGVHNSLAIVENIVELGPCVCQEAFFMLFFIHGEEGDGVHNSLAIVENIVEFWPAVYREVFYNIICPFYAFLYTQRREMVCTTAWLL
jgi:hypothetical protein